MSPLTLLLLALIGFVSLTRTPPSISNLSRWDLSSPRNIWDLTPFNHCRRAAFATCHEAFQSERASPSTWALLWKRTTAPPCSMGEVCQALHIMANYDWIWLMLWAHSTLPKPCSSNTLAKTYKNIQKQYCWKDVDNVDKKVREELSAWSFNSNPIDPPGTFPSPWTAGNRFSATASAATRAPPRAVAWPCRGLRRTPPRLRGL